MKVQGLRPVVAIISSVVWIYSAGLGRAWDDPLVYEPFAQPAITNLTGQAVSDTGLIGNWMDTGYEVCFNLLSNSLAYGNMQTSGSRVGQPDSRRVGNWATLDSILFDHTGAWVNGGELWFSLLYRLGGAKLHFGLGDQQISYGSGAVGVGDGVGFSIDPSGGARTLSPWFSTNNVATVGSSVDLASLGDGTTLMIVGRIVWGDTAALADTLELYLPDTDLNLGPVVAIASGAVDQSFFDTLSWANPDRVNLANQIDEIRIGLSYSDVNGMNEPSPHSGTTLFGK